MCVAAVDDVGLISLTHKIAVAECGGTQPKRLKSVEYIYSYLLTIFSTGCCFY